MAIPTSGPEVVLFAIQAAVKLGGSIRQSYVNNLKSKKLTLPLPAVDMSVTTDQITAFFEARPELLERYPKLKLLAEQESIRVLEPKEEQAYRQAFEVAYQVENQAADAEIQGETITSLVTFRQWANDKDAPLNGLRLVAGSLIEVGVDYLSQVPGAINPNSKFAPALQGVLQSLEGMDLSSRQGQSAALQQVAPQLFASAMEVGATLMPSITSDPKFLTIVEQTCSGVTEDLCARMEGLSTVAERVSMKQWGKAVFESTLRHAGSALVLEIEEEEGAKAFLGKASVSVMRSLLDTDLSGMKLKEVVSGPALDAFMQAGLEGIAENPKWMKRQELLGDVLSEVAQAALEANFPRKRMIPELARLTVRQTAMNLDRLTAIDPNSPQSLLITATKTILVSLSEPVEGENWKPNLSNKELLDLADSLMTQVAENPQWLTSQIGERSILGEVIQISLSSFQGIPPEKRFSGTALKHLLQSSIQAVAINRALLKPLPIVGESGKTALSYALNAAFAKIYGQEGASENWQLAKTTAISEVVGELLSDIAQQPVSVSIIDQTIQLHFGGVESELVAGLLHSIDGIDLGDGFKNAFFKQLAPELLQHTTQTLEAEIPNAISDPNFRQLLSHSSQFIAQELSNRLTETDAVQQQSWKSWAGELAQNLAVSTGTLAYSASVNLFIESEETKQLVDQVGLAMIEAATASEIPLKEVLRGDSLREVVEAGLLTASEHPEAFGEHQALGAIVHSTITSFAQTGIKRPNLLPELIRVVLEKAQANLYLVWQPQGEMGNLLAKGIQQTLELLTAPPQQGVWKPMLTQQQLLQITSLVLDQIVENPNWVTEAIGSKTLLQQTLKTVLQSAGSIPSAKRLSPQTWQVLFKQSLKAVALRQQLLDRISGNEEAKATILGYTIDSLLSYLFSSESPQVRWASTKSQMLNILIEHVLNKVAIGPATTTTADKTMGNLKGQLAKLRDNEAFDSVVFLRELLLG